MVSSFAVLSPFIWMIGTSVRTADGGFGFESYRVALSATPLVTYLINGLCVCAVTLVLQLLVAAPCAYALAKYRFRGCRALFGLVLVALLIPHEVIALPLFMVFAHVGLLDTFAALVLPFAVSPFAIFLLRQFFRTIPDDVILAARLDGLSEWAILWRVMVPLAAPAVAAFAILSIVARWNSLYWPLIAVRSEQLLPPPAGILYFANHEDGAAFGPLMAAAVLVVAPLVCAFLFFQRTFISGLTAGRAK